jgi:BRCT domain type II-containing protein
MQLVSEDDPKQQRRAAWTPGHADFRMESASGPLSCRGPEKGNRYADKKTVHEATCFTAAATPQTATAHQSDSAPSWEDKTSPNLSNGIVSNSSHAFTLHLGGAIKEGE